VKFPGSCRNLNNSSSYGVQLNLRGYYLNVANVKGPLLPYQTNKPKLSRYPFIGRHGKKKKKEDM
jgi:hypothetical protein